MAALSSARILPILLASLSLISQASAAPGDASIAWADTLLGAATPDDPNTVLGPPDDQVPALGDLPAPPTYYVWVRDFRPPRTYSKFAEFLGVTDEEVTGADVIAFEGNGCAPASGGGWESSIWFFSDLTRSYAETFDERSGLGTITTGRRAVFKTGSMRGNAYGSFFGVTVKLCEPPPPAPPEPSVISWLLIDVPDDINVHSPNFSVWLGGAGTGLGSGGPDPDAIGLLTAEASR